MLVSYLWRVTRRHEGLVSHLLSEPTGSEGPSSLVMWGGPSITGALTATLENGSRTLST